MCAMSRPYAARGLAWASRSAVGRAWRHSRQLDLGTYTLALAAQQVLCTAPLLVAISAIMRRFHTGGVVGMLADYLDLDPQSRRDILALFATQYRPSFGDLVVGFGVAFLFATGVAVTLQRVFEEVWTLPRAGWQTWWRQIVWALMLVPLLSLAVWSAHLTRGWILPQPLEVAWEAIGFGVVAGAFFAWSQHFLLLGQLGWRRIRFTFMFLAVGLTLTELASQLMVPSQVLEGVRDYGLIGATFVLSGWVLVISTVVVAAAVLGYVTDDRAETALSAAASAERRPVG